MKKILVSIGFVLLVALTAGCGSLPGTGFAPATAVPQAGAADTPVLTTPSALAVVPDDTPAGTEAPPITDTPPEADMATPAAAVQSYRAKVTIGLSGSPSSGTYETEYVVPDKSSMAPQGQSNRQIVTIGDTTYYQQADGTWKTLNSSSQGGAAGSSRLATRRLLEQMIQGMTDARLTGQEDVSGTSTQAYKSITTKSSSIMRDFNDPSIRIEAPAVSK